MTHISIVIFVGFDPNVSCQPAYYQPAPAAVYNQQPSAAFTSFAEVNGKFADVNGKVEQAPVAAVIETAAEKGGDDDGEVRGKYSFAIFIMLSCGPFTEFVKTLF